MSTMLIKIREEEGGLASPAKEKASSRGPCWPGRPPVLIWRLRNAVGFFRSRVLVCFLVLLFLVVLYSLLPSFGSLMGWKLHQPSSVYSPSRGSYTVLINSWRPSSHLKRTVTHYASCTGVDAVHVVWSSTVPPSEDLLNSFPISKSRSNRSPRIEFDLNFKGDFKSRFRPIGSLRTDAVFSVDDDTIVPCPSLEFGLAVWRTAPSNMVGFVPRLHVLDNKRNGAPYYRYEGWWTVWWRGAYSFVLAEAAFFHRKYLDMYASGMPSRIYEYLSRERVCEDIAMSLLVANATGSPAIWVKGKTYKIAGSSRISVETGGGDSRNNCLNDLFSVYGSIPLVETNMKAVDARQDSWW
ncbi:hypothetical protein MLD38_033575 [Melastoma candidum]|uniref:Uncharacterized protein n=1 Tax=Melastoma candidum TaxID=119954 RepID=A0ACB9M6W3_9MYRT|nr:hypothetical protein MLD38_033575 [Melastoma candidum]